MKAIIIDQYGDASELHESDLPIPKINKDEVLVKVKATSVNPIDWKVRQGYMKKYASWQFPIVLGWDVAGVITEVGSDVTNFKVGDEVLARPDGPDLNGDGTRGTYAEYAVVKSDKLVLKPDNISFNEAAAIPLAGLTAWQVVVDQLKIKSGDKILIQGGAGGVGMFAIQIAKHLGAYVATTASPENEPLLYQLGADYVIDYHKNKIRDVISDYNAVFDTINQISEGLSVLKNSGHLVTIAGIPTDEEKDGSPSATSWWLQPNGSELKQLTDLIETGEIKVIIDSIFPLATNGLRDAHKLSESGHAHGKIVISVTE